MPVLLVRHAKAGSRRAWVGDDRLRPLSGAGRSQAGALVDILIGFQPARVLCSPFVRCVETVEPLAARLGVDIETTEALAEGHSTDAVRLVEAVIEGSVVLCTHGDIVPSVLEWAATGGALLGPSPKWPKGSTWVLDRDKGVAAQFVPAPLPDG